MSRRGIMLYCAQNHLRPIPLIVASLGELDPAFAVFRYPQLAIVLRPDASVFLAKHPAKARVWWLNYYLLHELIHYKQYLGGAKRQKDFDEKEAEVYGQLQADNILRTYTLQNINPIRQHALSLYQAFHSAPPKHVKEVHLPEIKRAVKIGRLKSLVYAPEAPSKRKGQHFEHSFGDYGYKFEKGQEPILAVSADGKQLIVIGGVYHFNERGIVG